MRVVQKITFEAKDDAEAIRVAADRLGRDAVVLSTRSVSKGGFLGFFTKSVLLVTAGLLEEDPKPKEEENSNLAYRLRAFQQLLESKSGSEPKAGSVVTAKESEAVIGEDHLELGGKVVASGPSIQKARQAVEAYSPKEKDLSEDVDKIQKTLALVLERLNNPGDQRDVQEKGNVLEAVPLKSPVQVQTETPRSMDSFILDMKSKLVDSEVTQAYAEKLVAEYDGSPDEEAFCSWLASKIDTPYKDNIQAIGGPKVMFIGPTGVGKTTTIAKLAAISSLWEDRQVLLATSDTYRIAAVEQLRTYAKILGVPVEVVFDPKDLEKITGKDDSKLVLLDTAGRSQRDRRRVDETMEFYRILKPDSVHLVISASSKYRDMLDVIEKMGVIPITSLIFTKLDETLSLGPVLEVMTNFRIPVSFFTSGQNVPNDIEVANGERLVHMVIGGKDYD